MSTDIEYLRRVAKRDVKDHTAIFDLYVVLGRDLEYLAIKYGMDPEDIIHLLEGYGETVMKDGVYDPSGCGRLPKLSRLLIQEYVEQFYPGISSENPQNDWICLEAYLDQKHPHWRQHVGDEHHGWKRMR
ncbi:MAG: hypothetical protein Q4C25_02020 [Bacillota bacterium]|nr:hypothetical protein [Bacillota bacterium]